MYLNTLKPFKVVGNGETEIQDWNSATSLRRKKIVLAVTKTLTLKHKNMSKCQFSKFTLNYNYL